MPLLYNATAEDVPLNSSMEGEHHPIHDYSGDSNVRKRRNTVSYRRHSCTLQTGDDIPYYVQLAANIFGLESSGDKDQNLMNLEFTWKHNDRISHDQFNATNNLCLWTNLPHSVVSMNLSLCLCKQLNEKPKDFLVTWLLCAFLPLFGALFVELSTVNALRSYENFGEVVTDNFCNNDWELQCGVIGVFLISLLKPLYDILTEIFVGLYSTKCVYDTVALQQLFISSAGAEYGAGKKFVDMGQNSLIVKDVKFSTVSAIVYWVALGIEIYVFYLTVVIGMYYTLSQQDASAIVQAAVAISFINEIDNILYEAVASTEVKEVIETCKFEVSSVPKMASNGFFHFAMSQHQLLLQAPLLIFFTFGIVIHLRMKHCDSDEVIPF